MITAGIPEHIHNRIFISNPLTLNYLELHSLLNEIRQNNHRTRNTSLTIEFRRLREEEMSNYFHNPIKYSLVLVPLLL